jgi:hypothetical protein
MTAHPGRLKVVVDIPLRPRGDATRALAVQALTQQI